MKDLRARWERNLGWGVLFLLLFGCLIVLRPLVSAMLWAVVLCFASWPIYQGLLRWLGNRRSLVAILMTLAVMLVMLLPCLIVGVPGPVLLALLTFFFSFVPVVGTGLVWIPAAIWLFHQGSNGWGVFTVVWGLGVGTLDSFIKPWLISHGSDMPFILISFGVLGGALAFGFIGVFLGPTLLAVGYRLLEEWNSSAGTLPDTGSNPGPESLEHASA